MTTRRFFSSPANVAGDSITLDADETRHLRDVLRFRPGVEIAVFDGEGREYLCRVEKISKTSTTVSLVRETEPSAPESPIAITLASVVIPGDKYDLIVQKAVELGVTHLIPLASLRSEVKLRDLFKKLTRWRRIALDAAKQCGRARLMSIGEPRDISEILAAKHPGEKIFFSEREGETMPPFGSPTDLLVVIGPKGGWDDAEIETARQNDLHIVTLGGRIMRAETAAIALTAILQHRFGDIN